MDVARFAAAIVAGLAEVEWTQAVLIGVVEERCLRSGKFDSAPSQTNSAQANPAEQANLGRSAIYGTALDTPQEPVEYPHYTPDSKSGRMDSDSYLDASLC